MRVIKLEKKSTKSNSDDVGALLRRCAVLESEVATLGDALKSFQGSNVSGLVGEIDAQVGGNKASVIAELAKNSWNQLTREEKEIEVRKNRFILYNIAEQK